MKKDKHQFLWLKKYKPTKKKEGKLLRKRILTKFDAEIHRNSNLPETPAQRDYQLQRLEWARENLAHEKPHRKIKTAIAVAKLKYGTGPNED